MVKVGVVFGKINYINGIYKSNLVRAQFQSEASILGPSWSWAKQEISSFGKILWALEILSCVELSTKSRGLVIYLLHVISILAYLCVFLFACVLVPLSPGAMTWSVIVAFPCHTKMFCNYSYWFYHMGLAATKPAFGVSDKASFKQVSSATEIS